MKTKTGLASFLAGTAITVAGGYNVSYYNTTGELLKQMNNAPQQEIRAAEEKTIAYVACGGILGPVLAGLGGWSLLKNYKNRDSEKKE